MFLDDGLKAQTEFDLDALERATGRTLDPDARAAPRRSSTRPMRWTYLGSGMIHPTLRRHARRALAAPRAIGSRRSRQPFAKPFFSKGE